MKFMSFRKLLPVFAAVAALSFTAAAHAQVGVFGTVTGEWINGVACSQSVGNGVGTCTSGTTTDKPYGANFGGYYDFRSLGPVRFGVEIRGGVLNTNKDPGANIASTDLIREYTALGGVRASTGTPIRWLHPFASIDAGYAKFGPVYAYNTYTDIEGPCGRGSFRGLLYRYSGDRVWGGRTIWFRQPWYGVDRCGNRLSFAALKFPRLVTERGWA